MAKENYMKDLALIGEMANKIRKTVNESIMFNENDEYGDDFDERMGAGAEEMPPMENEPMEKENPEMSADMSMEDEGMSKLDEMGTIDQIRELVLKGMIRLCKTPEDPEYQALNKIFKMCDKSVDADIKNQEQQKMK